MNAAELKELVKQYAVENYVDGTHDTDGKSCRESGKLVYAAIDELVAERDKLAADKRELVAALDGMVEIAELTVGWLPTPPNADGPLITARAALAKHGGDV